MADAEGLRLYPPHVAYAERPDQAPRNRDRLIELAMGVCIIGVLAALYVIHAHQAIIRAHLANAYSSKDENQITFLETLALEGEPRGANHGGVVGLTAMNHGATGLKFMTEGDTTYVVNWRCTTASQAEIEQELATGEGAATKNLRKRKAKPIALSANTAPQICQGEARNAQ